MPAPVSEAGVWSFAEPEQVGLDKNTLVQAEAKVRGEMPGVHAILVARHGRIVLERYYHGLPADQPFPVYSITKSVVSALAGIAIAEGKIRGIDERLSQLLPVRNATVGAIELEHLLTMTGGWHDASVRAAPNVVRAIMARPLAREPGREWEYDSGQSHLVSAVISRATGQSAALYAQRKLFRPLRIERPEWAADPQGVSDGGGVLSLKVRDLAKLGELYLRGGRWRGRQLVPERWVRVSTRAHVATDDTLVGYGYLWWIGKQPNSFAAIGYGGQMVSVLPAQDLVVVVTADPSPPPDTRRLLRLVRLAVRG
jgi:CubicO group peptidase (beta-lactamase class C family)